MVLKFETDPCATTTAVLNLGVFFACSVQIATIAANRHNRRSLQGAMFVTIGLYSLTRAMFFLGLQHNPSWPFEIGILLLYLPSCLRFLGLSLLQLFYSSLVWGSHSTKHVACKATVAVLNVVLLACAVVVVVNGSNLSQTIDLAFTGAVTLTLGFAFGWYAHLLSKVPRLSKNLLPRSPRTMMLLNVTLAILEVSRGARV